MNESVEEIEWGLRRKPLYERQRNAIREMEDKKDGKEQCSSGNARERNHQV